MFMDRRKAREYAFIILFQYKFQPEEISEILADFFKEYETGKQGEYISAVVSGAVKNIERVDGMITRFAKGWTIDRLGAVSLAVLRLGVCEMLYLEDVPLPVSVNEATTLARLYGGEENAAYVNGVLGAIQRELEGSR